MKFTFQMSEKSPSTHKLVFAGGKMVGTVSLRAEVASSGTVTLDYGQERSTAVQAQDYYTVRLPKNTADLRLKVGNSTFVGMPGYQGRIGTYCQIDECPMIGLLQRRTLTGWRTLVTINLLAAEA